jgi:5-methyltetrahydrofolate--homocysteine methyltransferase
MDTVISSSTRTVVIGPDQPFCIIGERINPTGRKAFQKQLQQGDTSQIDIDVAEQIAGGAHVLDVNVGDPLADEVSLMRTAVKQIQAQTDMPLCIDSSVIEALEAGLEVYQGKALVNSVTGEEERMEAIFPIVARYGAAVVALANDDEIRMEPEHRVAIVRRIVSRAADYGIKREDLVIDALAMPIGAEPRAAAYFFETLRLIRDEFGLNTTCGASNTSFGMPGRHALNAHFIATASTHGLTSAIMDARNAECVNGARAADVLHARDEYGMGWIKAHRAAQAAAAAG